MFGRNPSSDVDRAVRAVHRRDFLPIDQQGYVANDAPLPIGHGQTISQPSLVAEMTRELSLSETSRVLEIGTGSGYQTAILAEIAAAVFTIERIAELGALARTRLSSLGYANVQFRIGDGALGWPEAAPFDGIVVTAAPLEIPPALIDQLAPNGRMVIPVGRNLNEQMLVLVTKDVEGNVWKQDLFGVRFVPLISQTGNRIPETG